MAKNQVLPGIEPGFRDSESPVITVTLQDHTKHVGTPVMPYGGAEKYFLRAALYQKGGEPPVRFELTTFCLRGRRINRFAKVAQEDRSWETAMQKKMQTREIENAMPE